VSRYDRRENQKFLVLLVLFALLLIALFAPRARAQQQADPGQQLAAEWQALALQQHHAEDAINRLIQSYEARLSTALSWLQQAQQQSNDKH
jgi:predicted negative regulator of RcsB-dependent stress response